MPFSPLTIRRLGCLVALLTVVILGVVSRRVPLGWWLYDKSLGDVLYAIAAYLAWTLLSPRRPPWQIALLAWLCCLAVELLQLTEINARLVRLPVLGWFLGTTFSWHDLFCYLIGIIVIVGIDIILRRLRRGFSITPL